MKTLRKLYRRPTMFICPECSRPYTTLLGYQEHFEGAKRAGSHIGRQCEYAVYPFLCAAADCERSGRMCGIMEEALRKREEEK